MTGTVLITGGAGFIGSHVADALVAAGWRVRVLDSLEAQVHGPAAARPAYLTPEAEFHAADLRDGAAVRRALEGVDAVCHLAARVGVGQSMYAVADYVGGNDHATAVLLQALTERPVARLVVASSMSVYGEGLYRDAFGRLYGAATRSAEQLRRGHWDPVDAWGQPLRPVPTPESKPTSLASVYALSKYVQERLCLMIGAAYGIDTVALRLFNVYGPRQALSNPYTGVLAIFAARLLNGRPPLIFEDGHQRRDFVHVRDVARAVRLALETPAAAGQVFNIGSGESVTVAEVAQRLARALGRDGVAPEITGRARVGDIRHCFADVGLAREVLGYEAGVGFDEGLRELIAWLAECRPADRVDEATAELVRRGLIA